MSEIQSVDITDSTTFINILSGEFNFRLADIRRLNRNIMWPPAVSEDFVAALGYAVIRERAPTGSGEYIPSEPVEEDGYYFQGWKEHIPTEDEVARKLKATKEVGYQTLSSLVEEALKRGVVFNFGTEDQPNKMHIQIRDTDRTNILDMVVKSQRDPSLLQYFRTYENRLVQVDHDQVIAMSDASYAGFTTIMGTKWAVQDMIAKATSVTELPSSPPGLKDFYLNYAHLEWIDIE